MKNSNFIAESVFRVNVKYAKLQNETKELFFRCLDEGQELSYFKAKLEELWGKIDYSFLFCYINECQQLKKVDYFNEHNREEKQIFNEVFLILEFEMGNGEDCEYNERKNSWTVVCVK